MISAYAIVTLVLSIISIFFVIHPVLIPTSHLLPQASLDQTTAPILAILILWAAQCITPAVIRNGIVGTEGVKPYNIVILFFSLAYMTITLDISGVLRAAAYWVSRRGDDNGWKLYLYLYVLFTLISILLGNDPAVLSGTAFLAYYTRSAGLDPIPWVMAEFAAANTASMVLFVGNPANDVICEGFGVDNAVFTAYTALPFLACNIFCFAVLAFQYRMQVPRRLTRITQCYPRGALRDPVAACVGGILFGAMLVLCLVAHFYGVDVWMISLPFALSKFFFDLAWDYYRFSHNIPVCPEGDEEISDGAVTGDRSLSSGQIPNASRNDMNMADTELESNDFTTTSGPDTPAERPRPVMKTIVLASINKLYSRLGKYFPTVMTALPQLHVGLVFFIFPLVVLVEALDHQGWVNRFGDWLAWASHREIYPAIWLVGILDVLLCNLSGTSIGVTILLTKVARAAALPPDVNRAVAIALAVTSNIGAVNMTFSASLAGLLWRSILEHKGVHVRQQDFAFWNLLPLLAMTTVGLGVVSAEMAVLTRS